MVRTAPRFSAAKALASASVSWAARDRLRTERPDATSLFTWVLVRLAPFGEENVRLWCSYLALGRVGISSEELVALLPRKRGPEAGAAALRLAQTKGLDLVEIAPNATPAAATPAPNPLLRHFRNQVLRDPTPQKGKLEERGDDTAPVVVGLERRPALLEISYEVLHRQFSDGCIGEIPLQPLQVATDP